MEGWWQDIRHGLRVLFKARAFTAVAVLSLAIGIGANSAIFSVTDALLLRPLPYRDSGQAGHPLAAIAGAAHGSILKLVLRQSLTMVGIGLVVGIGGTLALTRVMKSLVFGVITTDAVTFVLVPIVLGIVALLASCIPARRAERDREARRTASGTDFSRSREGNHKPRRTATNALCFLESELGSLP